MPLCDVHVTIIGAEGLQNQGVDGVARMINEARARNVPKRRCPLLREIMDESCAHFSPTSERPKPGLSHLIHFSLKRSPHSNTKMCW
jgi:hypothetical protein